MCWHGGAVGSGTSGRSNIFHPRNLPNESWVPGLVFDSLKPIVDEAHEDSGGSDVEESRHQPFRSFQKRHRSAKKTNPKTQMGFFALRHTETEGAEVSTLLIRLVSRLRLLVPSRITLT